MKRLLSAFFYALNRCGRRSRRKSLDIRREISYNRKQEQNTGKGAEGMDLINQFIENYKKKMPFYETAARLAAGTAGGGAHGPPVSGPSSPTG